MSGSAWNTIESGAGVFTELVEKLGVKGVQFEELYSMDSESLKALQPLYGVVFLFKFTNQDKNLIHGEYDESDSVFFAQQMIQNACGTQAVLNMLCNCPELDLGPQLGPFKEFISGFPPDLRGETITNFEEMRSVHNSFSSPNPFADDRPKRSHIRDDDDVYHFITYVAVNGSLYELDGLKRAPINHGPCEKGDEFCEKLPLVLQERISHYQQGELRFSMLACCKDKRLMFQEIGDLESLSQEEFKRQQWSHENAMMRHDWYGMVWEVTKGIARSYTDKEFNDAVINASNKGRV